MKKFNKISVITVIASLVLGLSGPSSVVAATAPSLGAAATYSVYGDAGVTNNAGGVTHVWGNVGHNNLGATNLDDGTQVDGIIDAGTGVATAASAAFDALAVWGADGTKNLNTNPQTITPGVYTVDATQTVTGDITLSGAGVYIFRSDSAYHVANSARVLLTNGATACNVFWRVPSTMTIGTNAQMVGTIIAGTEAITINTGTTLQGRAISLVAAVTLLSNQITEPTCAAAAASTASSGPNLGTINVVKVVINDNNRTKTVADFPLFINGSPTVSGETKTLVANSSLYTVTETADPNYTKTFSGDCDSSGRMYLHAAEHLFCILTNDDIGAVAVVPPLIDLVKTASPLNLPAGPGSVVYTYTLTNVGTVPVTGVTIVGDTCSPIVLVSGDTNGDAKLDVNETWVNTCTQLLSETHTNIAVATGWANGISAVDIASATVVVGAPVVPPLIHVTKTPSKLTLPVGGGLVIYTKKVTNPGTVALSNIRLTDDKCSSVIYVLGDTNGDSKLDVNETWTYLCSTNLTKTTVNTATVSGDANGLTARDFALATVVVPTAPGLPNTGFGPDEKNTPWEMIILSGVLMLVSTSLIVALRKYTV